MFTNLTKSVISAEDSNPGRFCDRIGGPKPSEAMRALYSSAPSTSVQ
jgi:hypothetical protein